MKSDSTTSEPDTTIQLCDDSSRKIQLLHNYYICSCNSTESRTIKLFSFSNFAYMFTLRSTQFPKVLMREFDFTTWAPYVHGENLHPVAQARQERVLQPLLGLVAAINPWEYHTIAHLMSLKVHRIIELASSEKVNIWWTDTTILQILADSILHHPTWYSVVWFEQNEALRVFVRQKLWDIFSLKQL